MFTFQTCFKPLLLKSGRGSKIQRKTHRVHILVEMKQDECICPLSWSVHCNFVRDGNKPGLIFPSWRNVCQKAAVDTLCVPCGKTLKTFVPITSKNSASSQKSTFVRYLPSKFSLMTWRRCLCQMVTAISSIKIYLIPSSLKVDSVCVAPGILL